MDEKEEETERMREWHVIMKSRGRRAVAAHPSNASDRILSLSFTLFFSLSISPLCLSACICHKSGGSKTVGCEKMMALTFYWQKIYIHYSSINTIPLHTPIQPVTQHLNTGCVVVCIFVFELSVCEVKNVRSGLGLDSDVSNQQRKVISANEVNTHRHAEGVHENKWWRVSEQASWWGRKKTKAAEKPLGKIWERGEKTLQTH